MNSLLSRGCERPRSEAAVRFSRLRFDTAANTRASLVHLLAMFDAGLIDIEASGKQSLVLEFLERRK